LALHSGQAADHQVPVGHDAAERVAVDHQDRADARVAHDSRRLGDCLVVVDADRVRGHDVADLLVHGVLLFRSLV
jgi:hypothetical protein